MFNKDDVYVQEIVFELEVTRDDYKEYNGIDSRTREKKSRRLIILKLYRNVEGRVDFLSSVVYFVKVENGEVYD